MSTKFFPKRGVPCNFSLFFAKVAGNVLDGRAGVCYDETVPRTRLLWSVQPDTGHVCGKNYYDMEEPEMKKAKKLAALILTMVMALSWTMSAMAIGISPRWLICPNLGCGGRTVERTTYEDGEIYLSASCNALNSSILHHHCKRTYTISRCCADCHTEKVIDTYTRTYCASEDKEF